MSNHYKSRLTSWGKCLTRKDFRLDRWNPCGRYGSRAHLKPLRKVGNQKLRRYKGDVADFGWYKKFYDVWWTAF